MQNLARTSDRIDALVAAFAATDYVVDAANGPFVIRVGETATALDDQLDNRPWAVITAHNPDGRRCPAGANAAAQRSLEACLRESRPAMLLKVCNRDPAGLWPDEPAWLFTPRSIGQVDSLARRFGQRAVLTGRPGSPAELRIYGESNDASGTTPAVVS